MLGTFLNHKLCLSQAEQNTLNRSLQTEHNVKNFEKCLSFYSKMLIMEKSDRLFFAVFGF